jgi:hypothetical protein
LLEEYNFFPNHLAQPLEVTLHKGGNAPFNLWGETIFRPGPHLFFENILNNPLVQTVPRYPLKQFLLKNYLQAEQ